MGIESFDWADPLIDNTLVVKDGLAHARPGPGWGFNFIDEFLEEIK
jgi:L-alanine-DL-glutamate epimerase-like enolase superfamily enzyme